MDGCSELPIMMGAKAVNGRRHPELRLHFGSIEYGHGKSNAARAKPSADAASMRFSAASQQSAPTNSSRTGRLQQVAVLPRLHDGHCLRPIGEMLEDRPVLHDDELPGLLMHSRGRVHRHIQQVAQPVLANRLGSVCADGMSAIDEVDEPGTRAGLVNERETRHPSSSVCGTQYVLDGPAVSRDISDISLGDCALPAVLASARLPASDA